MLSIMLLFVSEYLSKNLSHRYRSSIFGILRLKRNRCRHQNCPGYTCTRVRSVRMGRTANRAHLSYSNHKQISLTKMRQINPRAEKGSPFLALTDQRAPIGRKLARSPQAFRELVRIVATYRTSTGVWFPIPASFALCPQQADVALVQPCVGWKLEQKVFVCGPAT